MNVIWNMSGSVMERKLAWVWFNILQHIIGSALNLKVFIICSSWLAHKTKNMIIVSHAIYCVLDCNVLRNISDLLE